ncbi:TetR/AcrR family transcriptional regulator [Bacteroidia bacterium]|nr:TetR/AcrR family transcriptional regulator [Bacteroidia bacterium]
MTERKRQILQSAQAILKKKGYAATSVRDIAKSLEIEPASLYSHFSSKEDILKLTCFDMASKFDEAIQEINTLYFDAEQQLRMAIREHVQILTSHLDSAIIFLRDWRNLTGESHLKFIEKRNSYENGIRKIIQTGIDEGRFNESDIKFATLTVLSSVNWIVEWYNPNGKLNATQIAEKLSNFILSGLIKNKL